MLDIPILMVLYSYGYSIWYSYSYITDILHVRYSITLDILLYIIYIEF